MSNLLQFTLRVTDELTAKLAAINEKVERFASKVEKPHKVKVDTSQAEGGLSKLTGLAGRAFAAIGAFEAVKGIAGLGIEMEQTRVQFEVFTGSVQKGNDAIARLQKFAQITPFDDAEVIKSGRNLLAAGYQVEELEGKLRTLGNISAGTRKPLEELVSIYTKNKGSGLIQGEDLNQLSEAGIPMKEFAKVLGVTEDKVRKLGSEGKITFASFDKVLENMGGKTGAWGDMMGKQSRTVGGRLSSLMGMATTMGSKMGEALNPFIGKLVDGGNTLLNFVSENSDKIQKMFGPLKRAFQPIIDAVTQVYKELGIAGDSGSILTGVFNGLATVIRYLSPVIKIAAELFAKVYLTLYRIEAAVAKFIATSPRLQKFFSGLWSAAVSTFKGIAEAVGKYLGGVGNIIEGIFSGDFSKMKSGLMQTLNALGDVEDVGYKAADSFSEGYRKGFKKSTLFDVAKAENGGASAPAAFLAGGKKDAAAASLAPGLSAKATNTSGASSSSKVTHISLHIRELVHQLTVQAATVSEGADQVADIVIKKIMASLNDVNTIASAP